MSDSSRSISGAVKVEQSTKEAVAFDLMDRIALYEASEAQRKDRKYWLTLYRQCHKATHGNGLDAILTES